LLFFEKRNNSFRQEVIFGCKGKTIVLWDLLIRSGKNISCRNVMSIKKNKRFFTTSETVNLTNLSRTRLMELKVSGDLVAGTHWVYLGGNIKSKIGWDVSEIEKWMVEKTKKFLTTPEEAIAQMETYAETGA
tara:strand:+ start:1232 stop:1627 length:396 start_codon:yes stop_codon:yes gene_type:complete